MELEKFQTFVSDKKIEQDELHISVFSYSKIKFFGASIGFMFIFMFLFIFMITIFILMNEMDVIEFINLMGTPFPYITNTIILIMLVFCMYLNTQIISFDTIKYELMKYDEIYKKYNKNNQSIFNEELFNYLSIKEAKLDIDRKIILFNKYDITDDLLKCKTLEEQFILINDLRMKV